MNNYIPEEDQRAYAEVIHILRTMNPKYISRIPDTLITFFEDSKLQNYEVKLDRSIPLRNNDFMPYTFDILNVLNLNFWCEDEQRKNVIASYLDDIPVEFKLSEQMKDAFDTEENIYSKTIEEGRKQRQLQKQIEQDQIMRELERKEREKNENKGFFKKFQSLIGKKRGNDEKTE